MEGNWILGVKAKMADSGAENLAVERLRMMLHCDEAQARFLLEAAGGNLDLALQMALGTYPAHLMLYGGCYMRLAEQWRCCSLQLRMAMGVAVGSQGLCTRTCAQMRNTGPSYHLYFAEGMRGNVQPPRLVPAHFQAAPGSPASPYFQPLLPPALTHQHTDTRTPQPNTTHVTVVHLFQTRLRQTPWLPYPQRTATPASARTPLPSHTRTPAPAPAPPAPHPHAHAPPAHVPLPYTWGATTPAQGSSPPR